jgi:hypothetical protein
MHNTTTLSITNTLGRHCGRKLAMWASQWLSSNGGGIAFAAATRVRAYRARPGTQRAGRLVAERAMTPRRADTSGRAADSSARGQMTSSWASSSSADAVQRRRGLRENAHSAPAGVISHNTRGCARWRAGRAGPTPACRLAAGLPEPRRRPLTRAGAPSCVVAALMRGICFTNELPRCCAPPCRADANNLYGVVLCNKSAPRLPPRPCKSAAGGGAPPPAQDERDENRMRAL